ncbi:hypothetical protein DPMN_144132 [Dreissena polymorpha]|uniref:C2H2-type domain-containing protein n=1 Tax=Dreissena polymorpha TaxID=45954 RepID=A0A9D4GEB9_DREPO|nr:hypothetical protein DPMN_144132 [Dreissena polymorpha]
MWMKMFGLMMLGHMCGQGGLHYIMMQLCIQQHVNLSQRMLMLSNDVEKNPGPEYSCKWTSCKEDFHSIGQIDAHIISHVGQEKCCRWRDCTKVLSFNRLEIHALKHLYDDQNIFRTLEDWLAVLEDHQVKEETTNLVLCPMHLRPQLMLPLFDEEFNIMDDLLTYTPKDHAKYLEDISSKDFEKFQNLCVEFLHRRSLLGERWPDIISQYSNHNKVASASALVPSHAPRSYYYVKKCTQFDFVETCRPELGSNLFSGTKLKSSKRKREEGKTVGYELSYGEEWFKVLLGNLDKCSKASQYQQQILHKMYEQQIVTGVKQSFFTLEQEAARLSSVKNCTKGCFVCTIFKCVIEEKEIIYVRYFESGIYKGLMEQTYLKFIEDKFAVSDYSILLHNVITVEDCKKMETENNKLPKKRDRPDKIVKLCISKTIPKSAAELDTIIDTSEISMDSFIIHVLPKKSKASLGKPDEQYLCFKPLSPSQTQSEIINLFVNFRLNQVERKFVKSNDMLTEKVTGNKTLLEQSKILNCLSGDIKGLESFFAKSARFDSNFFFNLSQATSLRNLSIYLFMKKEYASLFNYFVKAFPELNNSNTTDFPGASLCNTNVVAKKIKRCKTIKTNSVTRTFLQGQLTEALPHATLIQSSTNSSLNLFQNYYCSLLDHGTFSIQMFDELGNLGCVMNDYDQHDGSFKRNSFVYVLKYPQETRDYYRCSCNTYSTLINIKNAHKSNDEFFVLDTTEENAVTRMHCKFLEQMVVSNLTVDGSNSTETRIQRFVQTALNDKDKDLVTLSCSQDTRKYSILVEGDEHPVFVHLTFNKKLNKYMLSCLDGKCRTTRGHVKNQ